MINFIKRLFGIYTTVPKPVGPGLLDITAPEGKIPFNEIVAKTNPVTWNDLDTSKLPDYGYFDQDGSGSCVACSRGLMASIMYYIRTGIWILFSPGWIYQHRSNKPAGGMVGSDAGKIESSVGHIPYDLMPSNNLYDIAIDALPTYPWLNDVAKTFQVSDKEITLPIGDIDTIVSVMQTTGKPINVWFTFNYSEWQAVPTADTTNPDLRHSVVFIPPQKPGDMTYGMYNGKKAFVIQDSWGLVPNIFKGKMRIITEDFFKARNLYAEYHMNFKFDPSTVQKPSYDGSVTSLQDCLKFDGEFPTNISSTGVLGPVTKGAIVKFQAKYGIPQTATVGPITTTKLQQLFP